MKKYIHILLILISILLISPVYANTLYTIPIATLSNSPADSISNYIGYRPNAPALIGGMNQMYFPTSGVIEDVELYDYSGTAGSNEQYAYYLTINNQTDYLIGKLSVATSERRFTNTSFNINVNAGDMFEIQRVHPAWGTNPLTNTVGGYLLVNSTTDGYVIPYQSLTSSPADSEVRYMGIKPTTPSTTAGTNKIFIPSDGNITKSYIVENNTVNGTAEVYTYFLQKNGVDAIISTLAFNLSPSRQFNNTAMSLEVTRGDYIELKRNHPAWTVNPLNNVVNGLSFVDTSISRDIDGYPIYVQALTSSPTDAQTVYIGQNPLAPTTSAGTRKVYIPTNGIINKVELYVYSGTAGTRETWHMYVRKNNLDDYLISSVNTTIGERLFKNTTMEISVAAGDYIEIKGVQPTWATKPATTIYGGYVWVDYGVASGGGGGDIILPPVSNFSANISSSPTGSTVKFFDQSNNTIPGSTSYYWNFIDGGTAVNSTDENPTFVYATAGTWTINHTISIGSTISKSVGVFTTYGGGTADGPPNASFSIILTDTSTNYPTSWKWNATNLLGNNTEVTFSTAQSPTMNFGTGNWRINFTATNGIGSNTTNRTVIGYNLSSPRVYFWNRTA